MQKEIKEYFQGNLEGSLSDEALEWLRSVLQELPLVGHALFKQLSTVSINPPLSLQQIYITIISNFLDKQEFERAQQFLRFLRLRSGDPQKLQKLLRRLIPLTQETSQAPKMHDTVVYTALLNPDDGAQLLQLYCQLEDEVYQQQKQSMDRVEFSVADFSTSIGKASNFWSNFVRVNNVHFGEYVILTYLNLLGHGKFNEATALIEPFEELKPLVILLAWDKFRDNIFSHRPLHEATNFWRFREVQCCRID